VAWLLFNGRIVADNRSVAEAPFTPELLAIGVACAMMLAIASALFPAIRAGRLPVADALRIV
jgi:ABC-type antimicrobial peptide transport system permease subunit